MIEGRDDGQRYTLAEASVLLGVTHLRNWRVKEIAARWGFSQNTVINLFKNEPGVLRLSNSAPGKRPKITLSIPNDVLLRVEERLRHEVLQLPSPSRNPLRIVRLRDLNARMPKHPAQMVKRQSSEQATNRKRVA
jgi:hypothetical protein